LVQTEDDFQSILKIFENNQKIILTEIKKLPYQIRTEFKLIQTEIDRAITVMAGLKDQELLKLIPHTTVNRRLQPILKIMDTIFTALDKFDDQEIILEYFHVHIQKISEFIQEED